MARNDDVADAQSYDDDEYDDEYDGDEEDTGTEYLFGTIPRTPGLIALAAIGVVILLLIAALVSTSFGFRGGINDLSMYVQQPIQDIHPDGKLTIDITTGTPAFGRSADGKGDLTISYDGEVIHTDEVQFVRSGGGRTTKQVPYKSFYVDNGEYTVQVAFEGYTDSVTVELRATAHFMIITQKDHVEYKDENSNVERVRYKLSLFPDDQHTGNYDVLFTPGEGHIWAYYVGDESDQDNRDLWEKVMNISFETDYNKFTYKFPGQEKVELGQDLGYLIDFDAEVLLNEKGVDSGYFTIEVFFRNSYGLEGKRFTQQIMAMPEDYPSNNPTESLEWIHLGDE